MKIKYEEELNLYLRNLFFSEQQKDDTEGTWSVFHPERIKGYCS